VLLTVPVRDVLAATPRARVVRLDLRGARFPFAAGQAVLVGAPGAERRKPYSIANAPEDARRDGVLELLVGVDEAGRAGPHLPLHSGAVVEVEGPIGRFTFPERPAERRFVFIAGGTGIAPLRSMLRHALCVPGRELGLLYSARTPEEFAFEDELRALAREGRIELQLAVTRAAPDAWTGTRGRIGRGELAPLVHAPATLCFICGPPALVDEMPPLLAELGVARERIRTEEWTA
jgi:ferredoxin-NADP reductase